MQSLGMRYSLKTPKVKAFAMVHVFVEMYEEQLIIEVEKRPVLYNLSDLSKRTILERRGLGEM